MSFTLVSPVTGAPVVGYLTSPTYTLALDSIAGAGLSKQYVVTSLGGTQTDVSTHSASSPFAVSMTRPAKFKGLSPLNASGQLPGVPRNVWKMIMAKGATPFTGQSPVNFLIRTELSVPAGVDVTDPNELAAGISLYGGIFNAYAKDIVESLRYGIL
ncbi:TPA_asm: coat protein [ssRNA phage SRR7976356_1]|uniref:Coat protein n=1 Tax=ssRNA phage SRR7976356_1 TaxID=2786732 RepID=A0A8S5L534_9VIRU|nr:coat protein [ssRNA phage SRR7976356_1]DAD52808.1 TPA_asm: coat protein [ssRNA phage SRR7976356_1]